MRAQIEKRLSALKTEYQNGEKLLGDLDVRRSELRDTMLRITGAIQVLEEALQEPDEEQPQHAPATASASV